MTEPTFWLSHINYCETNTSLSATGTIVLPVENLIDDSPSEIFRTTTPGSSIEGVSISVQFGELRSVGVVGLFNTNLRQGDTVTFILKSSLEPVAEETIECHWDTTIGHRADFVWAPPSVQADALEAIIHLGSEESPPRDVFDAGELWAGTRWSPQYGIALETQPENYDPTEVAYSRGQNAIINAKVPYRQFTLSFPALREREFIGRYGSADTNLQDLYRRNGSRRNVVVGLIGDSDEFTDERNYVVNRLSLFGLLSGRMSPQPFNVVDGERVYSLSLAVRETR